MRTVVIDAKDSWGVEYKKYRSTEEHIRQNQRENQIQRERDERARNENNAGQGNNPRSEQTVPAVGNNVS